MWQNFAKESLIRNLRLEKIRIIFRIFGKTKNRKHSIKDECPSPTQCVTATLRIRPKSHSFYHQNVINLDNIFIHCNYETQNSTVNQWHLLSVRTSKLFSRLGHFLLFLQRVFEPQIKITHHIHEVIEIRGHNSQQVESKTSLTLSSSSLNIQEVISMPSHWNLICLHFHLFFDSDE